MLAPMAKPADIIRLLIVEDHAPLAANLADYFAQPGYELDFAIDGWQAVHLLSTAHYDVIVLDVMLPGLSGFEVCRRLRGDLHCVTPVIMLTAREHIEDKATGFGVGADDYLVKPFNLKELELRILALHRRHHTSEVFLQVGDLRFDAQRQQAYFQQQPLNLPPIAACIFENLLRTHPKMLSYQQLAQLIWQQDDFDVHTLRTHVYALRKQLQKISGQVWIETVSGRGYRLKNVDTDL
jgi:hypothetical protein